MQGAYGGAFSRLPRALRTGLKDRCLSTPRASREGRRRCLQSQRRRQTVINFRKPIGSFTAGIVIMCVLALSAPASAKGGGSGGGSHGSRGPGRPPPPFFWTAPQRAAQLEAIVPSPANQQPGPPAVPLAIVARSSATR